MKEWIQFFEGVELSISYNGIEINIRWKGIIKKKGIVLKKVEDDDCFECVSHCTTYDGYPKITFKNKTIRLNRFMYCLFNDKSLKSIRNKVICHTCDNRLCCNMNHLIEGFPEDNSLDMCKRDRQVKGEKVHSSKLTEVDVRYILGSEMPDSYLAEHLNVSKKLLMILRKEKLGSM